MKGKFLLNLNHLVLTPVRIMGKLLISRYFICFFFLFVIIAFFNLLTYGEFTELRILIALVIAGVVAIILGIRDIMLDLFKIRFFIFKSDYEKDILTDDERSKMAQYFATFDEVRNNEILLS